MYKTNTCPNAHYTHSLLYIGATNLVSLFPYSGQIDLIRLIRTIGNPAFRTFMTSEKNDVAKFFVE